MSSPKTAVPDPRLEGLWRAKDGSDHAYIAFGSHAARGANLILKFGKSFANSPGSDQLGWSDSANFFVTRTKKRAHLNLNNKFERTGADREPKVSVRGYTFVEYQISMRGQLVIAELQGDYFAKAVKEGKLKGRNTNDGFGSKTLLTHSSDHIAASVEASKTEDAFYAPRKWTRIGGP